MLNTLISFHFYSILNIAIGVGYVIARSILGTSFFKRQISQIQQLKFARYSFAIAVAFFCFVPVITTWIHIPQYSNFVLEPILKSKSIVFLQNYKIVGGQLNQNNAGHSSFSIDGILAITLLVGFSFFFLRYVKNILNLQKIKKYSFCRHKINNVHILFNQATSTPFCWLCIKIHNIVLPNFFLERSNDLRLAVSHELQHIRQNDTYWMHFIRIIKLFCFWNPFMKLWITWFDELQEFSCDEAIVLRKKKALVTYAQCLINAVSNTSATSLPHGVLGIHKLSKSIIYRRVNMLFSYNKSKTKKSSILLAYAISFLVAISTAYAFNGSAPVNLLSAQRLDAIINQSHLNSGFHISATQEVVNEVNDIRNSDQARLFMRDSLQRMKRYQPVIQAALKDNNMPEELLALPLVESGYQPLDQNKNPVLAAGIWQIVPQTARNLNLIVNSNRDDRFDTALATKAALIYLKALHEQFNDWKLALIAYEIGEQDAAKLINSVGSRDAWVLARSTVTPKNYNLMKFISSFDASVIIMRNPSLISARS